MSHINCIFLKNWDTHDKHKSNNHCNFCLAMFLGFYFLFFVEKDAFEKQHIQARFFIFQLLKSEIDEDKIII